MGETTTRTISLEGVKYRDVNRNGVKDMGEETLPEWEIQLFIGGSLDQTQQTDADGKFYFSVTENTQNVKICEVLKTNWVQYGPIPGTTVSPFTADSSKCWTAANVGTQNVSGLDFGNYYKVNLKGMKFYDTDNDGTKDDGEPGLAGWEIVLNPGASQTTTTTAPGGAYSFEVEIGSSYEICETLQAGYAQTTSPPCWTGTVPPTDVENLNFGNNIRVSGKKFFDENTNGENDSEPGIEGFRIQISWCQEATCTTPAPVLAATVYTDTNGDWHAVLPPPPAVPTQSEWWIHVCEVLPPGYPWTQTAPSTQCYIVKVGGAGDPGPITRLDFGNYCRVDFGKTLGFWSNRNGEKVMTGMVMAAVLGELSALNLRNADGSHFDPTKYSDFRSWILSATATNMANMLSAQMAATYLSAKAANALGVMVWFNGDWVEVGTAIDDANDLLSDVTCGTTCVVGSDSSLRAEMAAYKDLFDAINNNRAAMQGCPVVYP